tara:strand:+ start:594 stop:890 length:297 start_codon:yes stop_codon:yes gene_type:complete
MSILFALILAGTAGAAFALMYANIKDINKPISKKRLMHPEMEDVEEGDELMVVKFHDRDPLYQSMSDRIETLRSDINDPWNEDDDGDGDGDVPSLLKR